MNYFSKFFFFLSYFLFIHICCLGENLKEQQPILILQDQNSTELYQNYIPELLKTEGLSEFQVGQLLELDSMNLKQYDIIILPHLELNDHQAFVLRNYINSGGILIGFRPDPKLSNLFGLTHIKSTLPEGWLKIDDENPLGLGIENHVLKYHGVADLYTTNGATTLAKLYHSPTKISESPAISIHSFGLGKAILFSFDLAESIVLMRQGNPDWAGYPNKNDGYVTMRASQLFMDIPNNLYWNDAGNEEMYDIPQADELLKFFSQILTLTNSSKTPLPRFWYFPNESKALLLLTGDQHGEPIKNSISEITAVHSEGGNFTEFLWYPFESASKDQVKEWLVQGHSFGIHFNDNEEEGESGVPGGHITWKGMENVLTKEIEKFKTVYPDFPYPATTRTHYVTWGSNDENGKKDPIAQAKLYEKFGIEMDVSFVAFPNRWGYMNGSGLPMKFFDSNAGKVIHVYEQATQYEDDVQLSNLNYSVKWDHPTALNHYKKSLSDSLEKYHTAIVMLIHPDTWEEYKNLFPLVFKYAKENSIPMLSLGKWLTFWKARANAKISNLLFKNNKLFFQIEEAPEGLTLLIPFSSNGKSIKKLSFDGKPQKFSKFRFKGIDYASVILKPGNHNVEVEY